MFPQQINESNIQLFNWKCNDIFFQINREINKTKRNQLQKQQNNQFSNQIMNWFINILIYQFI